MTGSLVGSRVMSVARRPLGVGVEVVGVEVAVEDDAGVGVIVAGGTVVGVGLGRLVGVGEGTTAGTVGSAGSVGDGKPWTVEGVG